MADTGNETPEAMFELGKRFYLPSSGVADPLLALYYFTKSAEAGYVPAQRVLGTCYLEGRLSAPDFERARHWLTEAARRNDAQAAYSLATMYAKGLGVEKNWELAWKLLDMECARQLAEARNLKEQLKEELRRQYPEITKKLADLEASRRSAYGSHRQRFIQPWTTPNRPQLEKEEFTLWLSLSLGEIAPERALTVLAGLVNSYYDQEESIHPQTI